MGKPSRDKGKRGEREVAQLFRRHGFWAERTRQSDGSSDPDVRVRSGDDGVELPLHVEVKRRKAIAALRFFEQADEDAGHDEPLVFLREDGKTRWVVMVDADYFLNLYCGG